MAEYVTAKALTHHNNLSQPSLFYGYNFYVGDMEIPIAPSEFTVKVNGKSSTVELIDGSEINILKQPKLSDFKFDILLPLNKQYPFAKKYVAPFKFLAYFEQIMLNRTPIYLRVIRPARRFSYTYQQGITYDFYHSTEKLVSLENYTVKESADNGIDLVVSLEFKEYINYGTKIKQVIKDESSPTKAPDNPPKKTDINKELHTTSKGSNKTYTVKSGDNLWSIARSQYGNATKWKTIYDANKKVIEDTAKKYGKSSSSNGHWIYPGTKLVIPASS